MDINDLRKLMVKTLFSLNGYYPVVFPYYIRDYTIVLVKAETAKWAILRLHNYMPNFIFDPS